MKRKQRLGITLLFLSLLAAPAARAELKVMTTTTDLQALFQEIGGERIQVRSIAKGDQDPHYVEAKPSYIVHLRKADALAYVGLQLEVGWLPLLIDGARNDHLILGAAGNIPMSRGLKILEIPEGDVSRASGDIHPEGNPHYWLDPRNLGLMAENAEGALSRLDPEGANYFAARREQFVARLQSAMEGWERRMAPHRGKELVCYHKQWEYLAGWLELRLVGYVENKPGIPPSPRHVQELEGLMKQRQVPLLLTACSTHPGPAKRVAESTGAELLILPPSVGGDEGAEDLFELFELITVRLDEIYRRGEQ